MIGAETEPGRGVIGAGKGARKGKFREEVGGGDADACGGGGEFAFGVTHVGAAAQQFGGEADEHFGGRGGQGRGVREFFAERAGFEAGQDAEAVDGLFHGIFHGGHGGAHVGQLGFGAFHIEFIGQPGVETGRDQFEGFFEGPDILAADIEAVLKGA